MVKPKVAPKTIVTRIDALISKIRAESNTEIEKLQAVRSTEMDKVVFSVAELKDLISPLLHERDYYDRYSGYTEIGIRQVMTAIEDAATKKG